MDHTCRGKHSRRGHLCSNEGFVHCLIRGYLQRSWQEVLSGRIRGGYSSLIPDLASRSCPKTVRSYRNGEKTRYIVGRERNGSGAAVTDLTSGEGWFDMASALIRIQFRETKLIEQRLYRPNIGFQRYSLTGLVSDSSSPWFILEAANLGSRNARHH